MRLKTSSAFVGDHAVALVVFQEHAHEGEGLAVGRVDDDAGEGTLGVQGE